jgi:hypothetical protein
VADVATAKIIQSDIDQDWLRVLAASDHGGVPDHRLVRWINTFNDELGIVRRARNSVLYGDALEDSDLAAAVEMAQLVLNAAKRAGEIAMNTTAQVK